MRQANQPFFYTDDEGVERHVTKGQLFGDKDAVLKGRDLFFDLVDTREPARTGAQRPKVDVPDAAPAPGSEQTEAPKKAVRKRGGSAEGKAGRGKAPLPLPPVADAGHVEGAVDVKADVDASSGEVSHDLSGEETGDAGRVDGDPEVTSKPRSEGLEPGTD